MENRPFIFPSALSSVLFGKVDHDFQASTLLTIRLMLCVLTVACVSFGISLVHFHSRYVHEAQVAGQLKSQLRSQVEVTNQDHRNLQAQVEDLSKTLEKTKVALALASRPPVFTTLPAAKEAPTPAPGSKSPR